MNSLPFPPPLRNMIGESASYRHPRVDQSVYNVIKHVAASWPAAENGPPP
jgi:hypothetical protein